MTFIRSKELRNVFILREVIFNEVGIWVSYFAERPGVFAECVNAVYILMELYQVMLLYGDWHPVAKSSERLRNGEQYIISSFKK